MSEIQVLIPLSVFGDAKDLTPQGISEALFKAQESSATIANLKQSIEALKTTFLSFSKDVATTIESDLDPFQKSHKLRELSREMQGLAQNVFNG